MPTARPRPVAPLRLGFVALTDAAPLVAAAELGLYARHGVAVALQREVGWATVRDKLNFRELDAAHAPAPMLWASQLGLGGPRCEVLSALVLNLHGNVITLSRRLRDDGVVDAATFARAARRRHGERRLTLGIVYPFSSHHLLLRRWLGAAGLDPDHDVRIVIVPPGQLLRSLVSGVLDGYSAGEPWGSLAAQSALGWCPAWSARLTPGHVEKVLLVRAAWARDHAAEHQALVAALAEACAWCDDPRHRLELVGWLARPRYLDLPAAAIHAALSGRFDTGAGRVEEDPDLLVFSRGGANVPNPERAAALQEELSAAGLLPRYGVDAHLPRRLFRADLYHAALASVARPEPGRPTTAAA